MDRHGEYIIGFFYEKYCCQVQLFKIEEETCSTIIVSDVEAFSITCTYPGLNVHLLDEDYSLKRLMNNCDEDFGAEFADKPITASDSDDIPYRISHDILDGDLHRLSIHVPGELDIIHFWFRRPMKDAMALCINIFDSYCCYGIDNRPAHTLEWDYDQEQIPFIAGYLAYNDAYYDEDNRYFEPETFEEYKEPTGPDIPF